MSRFKGTVSFWVQMLQFGSRTSASNVSKALDIYYTMPQKIQATESITVYTVKLNILCRVCPSYTICHPSAENNVPFYTKNFISTM